MSEYCNPVPPAVYAYVDYDEASRTLSYRYNGRVIVTIEVGGDEKVNFRAGSDSTIQTSPLVQQTFLTMDSRPATARVTVALHAGSVPMRPHRARREQAVLGAAGGALVAGANGLYDVHDDLLLDWHGRPWGWSDAELRVAADGTVSATFEVELGPTTWVLNLRQHYYCRHLGYQHHRPWQRRPNPKAVAGWCSWQAFSRKVTEAKVVEIAEFLAANFRDYGLEYVQIDDGYQRRPVTLGPGKTLADAWMVPNEDFPSGLAALADRIKGLGLQPGIWVSADVEVIEPGADGASCQLKGADGDNLEAFWMNAVLDCRPETIAEHLRPLYEAVRAAGFTYVKIDQIRHLLTDALQEAVRQGALGEAEAAKRFGDYMRATREALGSEVYYLASWGALTEVVGCADACRIAQDSNPQWPALRMQIVESARWFHSHRILFCNDPDHVCVRTNPEWARGVLSLVSLSGQLLMLSDQVADYDAQRVEMIQKCLPPLTTVTAETGPMDWHYPAFAWIKAHGTQFQEAVKRGWADYSDDDARELTAYHETMDADHPLASLWAFHLATGAGNWCVALRVATLPLRASSLSVTNLGLDADRTYLAFEFWSQQYLGEVAGAIDVPALSVGHCQVIAFRPKLDRPQLLGCSRHVSMGAVSVKAETWADGALTLELSGVVGAVETYWIHVGADWEMVVASVDGARVSVKSCEGGITAIEVAFAEPMATVTLGGMRQQSQEGR